MKMFTVIKQIRGGFQNSTRDIYPQNIGPFEDRREAEKALSALAALESIECATIEVGETNAIDKE